MGWDLGLRSGLFVVLLVHACGQTSNDEAGQGTASGSTSSTHGEATTVGGPSSTSSSTTQGTTTSTGSGGVSSANSSSSTTYLTDAPSVGRTFSGDASCVSMLERLQECGVLGDTEVQCPAVLAVQREVCLAGCVEAASCDELVETTCLGPIGTTLDPVVSCFYEQCLGWEVVTCPTGEFSLACSGFSECSDGSDEENCQQYTCADGGMIPAAWECDGVSQCTTGEDEQDCEESLFTCNDGSTIHETLHCGAYWECPNGEDEQGCLPEFYLYCPDTPPP